jgi:RNA polymerase sigma factor (sigma-70 family)
VPLTWGGFQINRRSPIEWPHDCLLGGRTMRPPAVGGASGEQSNRHRDDEHADRRYRQDVEASQVLIRVSDRWPEIGSPEAYVRKMVVNEYLSWRRRSWRLIPWGAASYDPGAASPDPADGYVERQALLAEMAKLSRRQRTALVLRYYEGFSDTEISEVMGCTPSTVRGHVFRALAALRVELSEPFSAAALIKEGR